VEITSSYAPWILRVPFCAAVDAQKRLAAASAPDGHVWRASYAALVNGRRSYSYSSALEKNTLLNKK
jgi:hypothetical protein